MEDLRVQLGELPLEVRDPLLKCLRHNNNLADSPLRFHNQIRPGFLGRREGHRNIVALALRWLIRDLVRPATSAAIDEVSAAPARGG